MDIMKIMIEAIEGLSKEDIDKFIKSLERLQTTEEECKRTLCENILFDMIRQYDNTFYKGISMDKNIEEEISRWCNQFK